MKPPQSIQVRGAREHNLRSLDVDIPRDRLVVMTGVSGSGKSSLAFDTIFAEGQRKFMESLSAYARQFLAQMQKPDVESIEGLPPTIAIEQRRGGHNPRSTVATTTEIYDHLRVLFARCGDPRCWQVVGGSVSRPRFCGQPISATSATQIVETLVNFDQGTRLLICSPVVRGRKRYEQHTIEAVVDRVVVDAGARQRIADSVEVALGLSEGLLLVLVEQGNRWVEHRFSEKLACPDHPECSLEELEPRVFSFNSPYGACPDCDGLGVKSEFDEELIVPDRSLGVATGAIEPWRKNGRRMNSYYSRLMRRFCNDMGAQRSTTYDKLSKNAIRILMRGSTEADEARHGFSFEGVIPNLRRRYENTDSDYVKERLRGYMSSTGCPRCGGRRLRTEALHVVLRSGRLAVSIADVTAMTIDQAIGLFETIELSEEKRYIAEPILRDLKVVAVDQRLRARRADDRAAPARQRPAHRHPAAPRPDRQHRPGGRARREDDPRRRPPHRHRARPGPPRRHRRRRGHGR